MKKFSSPLDLKVRSLGFDSYFHYLNSPHWKEVRKRQIEEVGYECECGSRVRLQLHHKTYARLGQELVQDLQWLCGNCHKRAHKIKTRAKGKVTIKHTTPSPRGRTSSLPSVQSANKLAKKQKRKKAWEQTLNNMIDWAHNAQPGEYTGGQILRAVNASRGHGSAAIHELVKAGLLEKVNKNTYRIPSPS
jgi:hypothetical protein